MFETIAAKPGSFVEIDNDAKLYRVTGSQTQTSVVFNIAGRSLKAAFEESGKTDLALRAAVTDAMNVFLERYEAYLQALQDPKLAEVLNAVAGSTTMEELAATTEKAVDYISDSKTTPEGKSYARIMGDDLKSRLKETIN